MKIYFILALFLILACKQKPSLVEVNGKLIDIDTIPFTRVDNQYKTRNLTNDALGLDSLENVREGIEIRIFRYYNGNDTLRLFVIKRRAGSWSGFTTMLRAEYNAQGDVRYIPSKRITDSLKSSWEILGNQLLSKGILNLGKEIPLPNNSSSDGDWVNIEYVADSILREYSVQDPEDSDMEGAKKLAEIIQIIEEELKFKNFATRHVVPSKLNK